MSRLAERGSVLAALALLAATSVLVACGSGFTQTTLDDDDAASVFDDDDVADDDDAAADDDDAAANDDDAAANDDDATGEYEGDDPGECSDGADNDQDGLFDCDDPNCFGAPACEGDDDDAADDDDATDDDDDDDTADDDDATADDDDAVADDDDAVANDDDATGSTAPVIVNVIDGWNASTGEFEFEVAMTDPDCNLGNPTLLWTYNGASQSPQVLSGASLTCLGTIYFFVGGTTPPASVTFTFQVLDSLGEFSNIWTTTVVAP